MSAIAAFRDGCRRVRRAPALVLGLYGALVLVALPAAFALRGLLAAHLGDSLAADRAADGVNLDWWNEFAAQAVGVGATFSPAIIGFGGTLKNLSDIVDGVKPAPIVAMLAVVYLGVLTFLSGGVIDRLARERAVLDYGFFAACGGHALRLLRLNAMVLSVFWWVVVPWHGLLFDTMLPMVTRDLTQERVAFAWRLLAYAAVGVPAVAVGLVADYARIRLVVEDRLSAVGALLAGGRFVRRRIGRALSIYLVNALAFVVLLAIWAMVAPGAGRSGLSLWTGFGVAQAYVVSRLVLRLVCIASQLSFFQHELAGPSHVAGPATKWPESPAVEMLVNRPDGASK
ncbi:MAG: hypothetical protein U0Q12_18540 [Vicinamibacterales bacterium]